MTDPARTPPPVRRLLGADAAAFHALRLEGFERHPLQFRYAIEDEAGLTLTQVAERLEREYVVGGDRDGALAGIGGLSGVAGHKLRHKAVLWGMYLRQEARGTGLADAIVQALLARARSEGFHQVLLTVAAENVAALRLYRRWGFESYGVEPRAVRNGSDYFDEALMVHHLV